MGGRGPQLIAPTSTLLRLQEADDRIAARRGEISALEGQLTGDPVLDRARADAAARRAEQERVDGSVAEVDARLAGQRRRARVVQQQLYGGAIRNPQDLLTLQRELDALTRDMHDLEETEFERMVEADASADARRAADAAVTEMEARRASQLGPLGERLARLRGALAGAERERDSVAAELTPEQMALYRRVASRHRPAVVRVIDGSCGGCRAPLSVNEVRHARLGTEIVQCPNCDRILVA